MLTKINLRFQAIIHGTARCRRRPFSASLHNNLHRFTTVNSQPGPICAILFMGADALLDQID
jgi:hypothetical protein